jgi:tetratricopeptide (TPR) repeat protein
VHHYQEAVRLYREVGDRTGEAYAHLNTGGVYEAQRRFREAVTHVEAGLALFNEAGEVRAAGFAYSGLAHLHAELGEHERALAYCDQALAPERGVGDMVRAAVLDSRGQALHHLGDHVGAVATFEESVAFLRTFPHPLYLAQVLAHLGDTHLAAGDRDACRAAWQEAADTFDLLHDARPAADEMRAKMLLLDGGVARVS